MKLPSIINWVDNGITLVVNEAVGRIRKNVYLDFCIELVDEVSLILLLKEENER